MAFRPARSKGGSNGEPHQLAAQFPPGSHQPGEDAFKLGYVADTNDTFAGYDGGWAIWIPYVVALKPGGGPIDYRIGNRLPMETDVDYFLCPSEHNLCQRPHIM
jgi:hypothetical protein